MNNEIPNSSLEQIRENRAPEPIDSSTPENKSVTLKNLKPVTPTDIAPYKVDDTIAKNWERESKKMDDAIMRNMKELYNDVITPAMEQMAEQNLDVDDDDNFQPTSQQNIVKVNQLDPKDDLDNIDLPEDDFKREEIETVRVSETLVDPIVPNTEKITISKDIIDEPEVKTPNIFEKPVQIPVDTDIPSTVSENDLKYLDTDEDEEDVTVDNKQQEADTEAFKKEVKHVINPINNIIDLSKFTISSKPIGISRLMTSAPKPSIVVSDWATRQSGKLISFSGLNGIELDKLDISNSPRTEANSYTEMFGTLYSHLTNPNKPSTMEAWLKVLNIEDLDDLFFGVFMASFAKSRFIPHSCPECNKVFLQAHEFREMYRFKDDAAKERFMKIIKSNNDKMDTVDTTPLQISDEYVVGLRRPSIYHLTFERATLNMDFRNKYLELLQLMASIDNIYHINRNNSKLEPVDCKPDPNDLEKTVKRRLKCYFEILKSITADQWSYLRTFIADMTINETNHEEDITYLVPATTCKFCGKPVPEIETSANGLLFIRHRLGTMASLS